MDQSMRRILLLMTVCGLVSPVSANDLGFDLSLKGTYTTSTRIIYDVENPVAFEPERVVPSNFGYGADIRWNVLWSRFYLGLSFEKIRSSDDSYITPENAPYVRIPSTESFDMTLGEVSGYYIVPISSDEVQFYMGGGIGLYSGHRNSSIAGISPQNLSTQSNFGIHVLTGIEYSLTNILGLRGELKFRDPHFDVTNEFTQSSVQYNGYFLQLRRGLSVTRVNLYGINYMVGLVFKF